ncbi:MAG TPA: MBL fold metallo-hydrolase [Chloroflexota bacterium]|nr:MBL fold metallo-hydrolase [Chloroflexota bacterium]
MKIGDIDVEILNDGYFHLDGGAMFGVVPRVLWEKKLPPDERNRVKMALRCLLIRHAGKTILIDTGIGDKLDAIEQERFGVERERGLLTELAGYGVSPDKVDIVVDTHLHMDHAGGNTTRHLGALVPTFPNAEYWIQRVEWEEAVKPNERTRATYLPDNLDPLAAAGQVRLIDGSTEIVPGVRWFSTPGHTRGHGSVLLASGEESALYTVDVCPFAAHLERLAWIPGFDVEPLVSLETKRQIVADAVTNNRLVIFDHDPDIIAARLVGTPERWTVEPAMIVAHPVSQG